MKRRDAFAQIGALASLVTLLGRSGAHALSGSAGRAFSEALPQIDTLSASLRGDAITDQDWREGLEHIFRDIALEDLLAGIDFQRLADQTAFAPLGVSTAPIGALGVMPQPVHFFAKVFAVGRDRAIIPHGHANMVSAHLTLSGRFHIRQYDLLDHSEEALHIRPSLDMLSVPGDLASIGLRSDNVHWFIAQDASFTLDVIATGLDQNEPSAFDIFNIDIEDAVAHPDGTLTAPVIGVQQALHKYG